MDAGQEITLSEHLNKYPILFAYIFGSEANNKAKLYSDIDIAILIDKEISKAERFDIRLRLSNELSSIIRKRIDLIVLNDINSQLAYEVIKHRRIILCKDRDSMIDFETKTLSKYLDRRYYDKRRAMLTLKQIGTKGII